jgi:hypothetical protein
MMVGRAPAAAQPGPETGNMQRLLIASMLMLGTMPLWAQDENLEPVPEPPEIPDPLESGQPIEPEVTIIRRDEAVIEEYRVNGRMYMVKVTPKIGKPYYLVDQDGDGRLESRMGTLREDFVVPQWVIFSW